MKNSKTKAFYAYTIKNGIKSYLGRKSDRQFIKGSESEVKKLFCDYAKYELDLEVQENDIFLEEVPQEKFYISADEYISVTSDNSPCKYHCNECGCNFFGKYHSRYSIEYVVCPVCLDETDPFYIEYVKE